MLFACALYYMYKFRNRFKFDGVTLQGRQLYHYDMGVLSINSVVCVGSILRFWQAYNYYGHHVNKIPHHNVLLEALPMILSFTVLGFMFSNLHFDKVFRLLSFITPWAITTTTWAVRNWEAEDYSLFFDGDALKMLGGVRNGIRRAGRFKSPLANLKGASTLVWG